MFIIYKWLIFHSIFFIAKLGTHLTPTMNGGSQAPPWRPGLTEWVHSLSASVMRWSMILKGLEA